MQSLLKSTVSPTFTEKRVPLPVKVGDTVLFSRYGYDEVKIEGQEYYIISESNILGIVK